MRRALLFPPTYDEVADKDHDAYMISVKLRPLAKKYGRYWSFHSSPTTVALPNDRYAKSLNSFTDHKDETTFRELLREYADYGCPRPSGYSDVFHEKFSSPRISWSINALLAPCMAGGWQAAIMSGAHLGTLYKYDMRSAYLWAVTHGLPDTRTYRRSLSPWKAKKERRQGLYRIKLLKPSQSAPFPFDRAKECIATQEEIEAYGLSIAKVVDGVSWAGLIDPNEILEKIKLTTTWKLAGRMFWGRWCQLQRVRCTAKEKSWDIPNLSLNIPWAHSIVSRVKMRLWEHSTHAVHVFVDSVITRDRFKTGNDLGDWRLEKVYNNGVLIRGPGQYGGLDELRLERMSGVATNSPSRYNPVAQVGQ